MSFNPDAIHQSSEEKKKSWRLPISLGLVAVALTIWIIPKFIRHPNRGSLTACKSNLKNIGTALEMYSTDYGGRYPDRMQRLTPNYLRVIPTCPLAGSDTYSDSYSRSTEPDGYRYCCAGANHLGVDISADYPAYDAITGLQERP